MPPGATVFLKGSARGRSPLHIEYAADKGPVTVILKKKGFQDSRYRVPVGARSVVVKLKRESVGASAP